MLNYQLVLAWVFLCWLFLSHSFAFYNINHYKLVVALAGAFFLTLASSSDWSGLSSQKSTDNSPARKSAIDWLLFLLLLLPILATLPGFFLSGGEYAYFFELEVSTWLVCCCWLFLFVYLIDDSTQLPYLLAGLALLVCASSGIAITNYVIEVESFSLDIFNRVPGTFGNANYLAAYLCLQLPVFLLCLLPVVDFSLSGKTFAGIKLIFLLALVLGTIALLLTQARAPLLVFAINLLILLVMLFAMPDVFGVSRKALCWLVVGAFGVLAATVLMLPVIDYVLERIRFGSTFESRLVPWRAAWASILDAPLLGWGPGSSYSLFFQYVDPESRLDWFERRYIHPHNEFLEILQEGGLFYLTAYLALISYFVILAISLFTSPQLQAQHKIVLTGLCLGIFSYHLLGIVAVAQRMISVKLVLFLLFAAMLQLRRLVVNNPETVNYQPGVGWLRWLTFPVNDRWLMSLSLVMLFIAAYLYYPVGLSRFEYVGALQNTAGSEQISALEKLNDENPNIYALETLIQLQLETENFSAAQHYITRMDEVIPNYDSSGYLKASATLLQGNLIESRSIAEAYQFRDLYHSGTAFLLCKIALFSQNSSLLGRQLEFILKPRFLEDASLDIRREDQIEFATGGESISIILRRNSTQPVMSLRVEEAILEQLVILGRDALQSVEDTTPLQRYNSYSQQVIENIRFTGVTDPQISALQSHVMFMLQGIVARSL